MLLPLPSRQAAERAEMHAVMLRYTAATNGGDACIVASPVSVCIYVILPPFLASDVYGASKYSISPIQRSYWTGDGIRRW